MNMGGKDVEILKYSEAALSQRILKRDVAITTVCNDKLSPLSP